MALTDTAHRELMIAVRAGLVECYEAQARMLREMAATPAMSVMDGPGALECAAAVVERAARMLQQPPPPPRSS